MVVVLTLFAICHSKNGRCKTKQLSSFIFGKRGELAAQICNK